MTRDAVTSDQLPASGLPFSVAVRGGGLLFLSGQVAQDPATGELVDGDVAQQADQILRDIAATLATIGKDLDDVIRVAGHGTSQQRGQAVSRDRIRLAAASASACGQDMSWFRNVVPRRGSAAARG
jgi:enamine deaminase RidA (YjgF/YER057c/UK114 family)